ncbi:MAG: sigma-70 family RNA polymerase sigma factor [Candidatus Omnitrophota bacterium]|nr:sigma-70 family RNA polymerase sigma factor [Candidatus Omnitrophota bacterium]
MEQRDEELIADYQQGNPKALEMLYERYKEPILNFALRILGNRADAEDVTADVFGVLIVRRDAYQPKAKFSTWLYTVTRNACISKIRKHKNVFSLWFQGQNGEYDEIPVPDKQPSVSMRLADQETGEQIRKAIEKLPDSQKEALILREYHGMSYDEISQVLGCSLENVKILIFRGRERLRRELTSFLTEENA